MTDMRTEAEKRAAVIVAARAWIGTPYHHMGRIKGVGIDCGMLLAEAFEQAGIVPHLTFEGYSPQFFLHSDDPAYLREIMKYAHEVPALTGPGDIVVFKIARQHAHGAIVTALDPLTVVHAYAPYRVVLEGEVREFGDIAGADQRFFTVF